jgi:hypothetical protein
MHSLVEMLRYMRPEGTSTQREFCERFLEPVFGEPDEHGNYVTQVGFEPHLCFTAHHDTVHKQEGMQQVVVTNDVVSVADSKVSSCLGADCTTGIYIILNMIEAGIEGTYVIHAAEEVGCKGSAALVDDMPDWLMYTQAVISFDRYGDKSVITHQMGMRTASDAFAKSFSDALNMPQLKADDGGSYTDSNEYSLLIPECTNISVGYYGQHGVNETQDLEYLDQLMLALESADWSKLVFKRDPSVVESLYYDKKSYAIDNTRDKADVDGLMDLVIEYPQAVAEMLREYGWTPMSLMEECQIDDMSHYYNYMDNYATRRYS